MNTETIWVFLTTQGVDFGLKILGALAAWIVGRWLIGVVTRLIGAALGRGGKVDQTLTNYLVSIIGVVLNIVLALAILDIFGVKTTSFAALLAGAGLPRKVKPRWSAPVEFLRSRTIRAVERAGRERSWKARTEV